MSVRKSIIELMLEREFVFLFLFVCLSPCSSFFYSQKTVLLFGTRRMMRFLSLSLSLCIYIPFFFFMKNGFQKGRLPIIVSGSSFLTRAVRPKQKELVFFFFLLCLSLTWFFCSK